MSIHSPKTNEQVILPSEEIESILVNLSRKIDLAITQCEGGSIVSLEVLKNIVERLSLISERIRSQLPIGEMMVENMKRIINQIYQGYKNLSTNQEKDIEEYITKIGPTPINFGRIDSSMPKREIELEINGKTVIVTVYINEKGEVQAWRINRQETKLHKWLDRLFENRSSGISLSEEDSKDLLNTITVTENSPDQKYDLPQRRTFVEITLSDGRIIQLTMASERQNNSYIAIWKRTVSESRLTKT